MSRLLPPILTRAGGAIDVVLDGQLSVETSSWSLTELADAMGRFVEGQTGLNGEVLATEAARIARTAGVGTEVAGGLAGAVSKATTALKMKVASAGTALTLVATTAGVALAGHAVLPEGLPSVLHTPIPAISRMAADPTPVATDEISADTGGQEEASLSAETGDSAQKVTGRTSDATGLTRAIEAVSAPKPLQSQSVGTHVRVVSILSLLAEKTPGGHLGELVTDLLEPGPKSNKAQPGKNDPAAKGSESKGEGKSQSENPPGKSNPGAGKSNRP